MTIDDPGAYVRHWAFTIPLVFQPDTELMEHLQRKQHGDRAKVRLL